MRKVFLNNDRSQIAFFVRVLSDSSVVIETQTGELQVFPIDKVGMLDLTERERYEFQVIYEKRNFDTQRMFFNSFLKQDVEITDVVFDELFEKSKQLSDRFIQKYNEQQ